MFIRLLLAFGSVCLSGACLAQSVTGTISGTVVDKAGGAVTGANVTLTSQSTAAQRALLSDDTGSFSFNVVPPGVYRLHVESPSFKRYEQRNIELTAQEHVSLGVKLQVGAVSDQVTVTADAAAVQTANGERSGVITSKEVENLTVINRDFATLVALMPGVVDNPGAEVQGFSGNATFNVNGGRNTSNSITIDGMTVENSNASNSNTFISIDAVETVSIKTSTFGAEFGRKPGATIQAVTKSGKQEFHGGAYYYKRHEMFNAASFFNNRAGIAMTPYRINTTGGFLGGPLFIPKLFNTDRKKLFFFVSSEQIGELRPQGIRTVTVPTPLERNGNFSQSYDVNGKLRTINDPLDSKHPFPNNVVPASRIDPRGQAYLNLLPAPNYFNLDISKRQYNYTFQESLRIPKQSEVVRTDYIVNPKTTIYAKFNHWHEDQNGSAVAAGNANWGWLPNHYTNYSKVLGFSVSRILSASTIVEASGGLSRWIEAGPPLDQASLDKVSRTKTGLDIPQFHPENNPYALVPAATFGSVNGTAANPSYASRFPLRGAETVMTANASITKTSGPHVSKLGIYAERWREVKGEQGNFTGTLDFSPDSNNPLDSNYAYSNAILGVLKSYSESSSRLPIYGFITGLEWFAQDNWKVNRRLTLDLGLRMGWSQPWHSNRNNEAGFVPNLFDPARQVQLIQPVLVNGSRVGLNPVDGQIYPQVAIGAIAPGSGDFYNGIVDRRANPAYPQGLRNTSGLKYAPRIGFAYDPFGKGKTALRGGFGVFYEVHEHDNFGNNITYNPPLRVDPTIYYTTLSEYNRASSLVFPSNITGFDPNRPLQRTMNLSIGISQALPFKMLLETAYVAALGRHLVDLINLNTIPFGANFQPQYKDPTKSNTVLPSQFERPYIGYGNINYYNYGSNSSYHSLQTTLNRRFSKGVTFGAAWTWSKAMDYVDGENNLSTLINPKVWNYGKAGFDRTHILKMSYTWDSPRFSERIGGAWVKYTIDNWTLSGISTFMSGAPTGIGLQWVNSIDVTGSPTDGARVVVLENPILPKDQRTFDRNFNTAAFGPPAVGTFGNAPKDVIRGPGINNWDLSTFKWIPVPVEHLRLQFRAEAYNVFNHTQFSGLDTNAKFDNKTGAQVNPTFGQFTSARSPRRMQLALRLTF